MQKTFIVFLIAVSLVISGCSGKAVKKGPTTRSGYKNLKGAGKAKLAVSYLRSTAIRDTALSVGARAGLAERAEQINHVLLGYEGVLYKAFNFHSLMLKDNVLPPVLTEGRNTLNLTGTDIIRIADSTYTILQQAKFVTASPTWREYLWMSYNYPEPPHRTLLPQTPGEQKVWEMYMDKGWDAGYLQGELIFNENIHRLKRDMEGMVRYRTLLAQNMVSPPYVASLDLGITGNGTNMSVNDRVLKITAFPSLNTKGENWKTEIKVYE